MKKYMVSVGWREVHGVEIGASSAEEADQKVKEFVDAIGVKEAIKKLDGKCYTDEDDVLVQFEWEVE